MTRNRSNSPTKRYRGDIEQPNLQEEDNFEDNIFDEKTTLAEVREKVFGEATGIQPEMLVPYSITIFISGVTSSTVGTVSTVPLYMSTLLWSS